MYLHSHFTVTITYNKTQSRTMLVLTVYTFIGIILFRKCYSKFIKYIRIINNLSIDKINSSLYLRSVKLYLVEIIAATRPNRPITSGRRPKAYRCSVSLYIYLKTIVYDGLVYILYLYSANVLYTKTRPMYLYYLLYIVTVIKV